MFPRLTYPAIDLGTRNGDGTGSTLLDGTFRPLKVVATNAIGNVSIPLTVAIDGATGVYVRAMNYADSTHPRMLQSSLQSATTGAFVDPGSIAGTFDVTVAGDYTLLVPLGAVCPALTVEVKATGALTADDSIGGSMLISDVGV